MTTDHDENFLLLVKGCFTSRMSASNSSSMSHIEKYDVDIRACTIMISRYGNLKVTNYIAHRHVLNLAIYKVTCSLILQTQWAPDYTHMHTRMHAHTHTVM